MWKTLMSNNNNKAANLFKRNTRLGENYAIDKNLAIIYAQTWICPMNETHKILLDFELQTDQSIPARRPNLVI